MKPGAPDRPLDPVARLGRICLALGASIVLYWLIWGRSRALPGPVAPDPEMFAAHAIARPEPAPAIVAAITARPLFLPERQAQDPAASGEAAAFVDAGPLSDARLVGIASESGGGIAIVSRGGTQFRVRQGEAVDGWTLESIRDNIAHFTRGDET
ncbi:MAG: hypothetical protein LBF91_09925, partial [Azoarcus sp.]|nr:hypothetical protein [Azoarcus sp.]